MPDRLRADRKIEVRPASQSSGRAVEIAEQRLMKGPALDEGLPVSPFSYEERQRRYEAWEAMNDKVKKP